MVHLDRIYTRGGDAGETSLGDGSRVPKSSPRIAAYGDVDELNAVLGLCLDHLPGSDGAGGEERARILRIQHELFDVGADLCVPVGARSSLRIAAEAVERLESFIDEVNEALPALTSFVLPGGTPLASHYHLARVVCRRAERSLLLLVEAEGCDSGSVNPVSLTYLNRLSDLFFVLARRAAEGQEILWKPEAGAQA
jgi:cob(I)alamin adenosyltransferase